jgi:hypothetical protein
MPFPSQIAFYPKALGLHNTYHVDFIEDYTAHSKWKENYPPTHEWAQTLFQRITGAD